MIVLAASVEAMIPSRDASTTDLAVAWSTAGRSAKVEAVGADVLLFGDSLVENGLVPRVIEEAGGLRAYNLALPAGTPESSYFLLRRALEAGARPRAIVVDVMPFQLVRNARMDGHRARLWPELAGVRDVLDLARSWREPDLGASCLLAIGLPSYRSRRELRDAFVADLNGREVEFRDRIALTRHNLAANRGALVMPDGLRQGPQAGVTLPDFGGIPEGVTLGYVDRFLRLAGSHGIGVYWLVPPLSPEFQDCVRSMGVDPRYTAFLRAVLSAYEHVVILDARGSGYGPTDFLDGMHLARRGAIALSSDVAHAIGSAPPTGRWVDLPPYRERSGLAPVTDVHESVIALGHAPGGARLR